MNTASISATLKAKGQAMTLTRTSAGTFDPVTGATSGGVTEQFTVYGITKNYKQSDVAASGSLVMHGDKIVLISADEVAPIPTDTLQIMGVDWKIISINDLSPYGVALFYTCQVRK